MRGATTRLRIPSAFHPMKTVHPRAGARGLLALAILASAGFSAAQSPVATNAFPSSPLGASATGLAPLRFSYLDEAQWLEKVDWQANWIWGEKSDEFQGLTFTKEFELSDDIDFAAINVTVGDAYWGVVVNGQSIGMGNVWSIVRQYDITRFLRKGVNSISIDSIGFKGGGHAGLLMEGCVYLKDGTRSVIKTDTTWKWRRYAQPSASWQTNTVALGTPPVKPWGEMPARPLLYPVDLHLISAGPVLARARPGDALEVGLTLQAKPVPGKNRVHFRLVDAPTHSVELLAEAVEPEVPTASWPAGQEIRVAARLQIPDAVIRNTYDLIVTVDGARIDGQPEQVLGQVNVEDRPRFLRRSPSVARAHFQPTLQWTKLQYLYPEIPEHLGDAGLHLHGLAFPRWGNHAPLANFEEEVRYLDNLALSTLRQDPRGQLFIWIWLEAPPQWLKDHPGESYIDEKGQAQDVYVGKEGKAGDIASRGSDRWVDEADAFLKKIGRHFTENRLYRDRLWGAYLIGHDGGEWHIRGCFQHEPDYSPAMQRKFGQYLEKKYGTPGELNDTWGTDYADFGVRLPSKEELQQKSWGGFRTFKAQGKAIDYTDFLADLNVERITHYAHTLKEATQGRFKVGVYDGYIFHWNGTTTQLAGHLNYRKVCQCPDIDFVANLTSYIKRYTGQTGAFGTVPSAVTSRGKIFINEADIRTHVNTGIEDIPRINTLDDCLGILRREFVMANSNRGFIQWNNMDSFRDDFMAPEILRDFKAYQRFYERKPTGAYFRPEIAFVVDTESVKRFVTQMAPRLVGNDDLWTLLLQNQLYEFNRIGAPYDVWLLDDLLELKSVPYKMVFFMNAFVLSDQQRAVIEQRFKKDHRTLVWVYAAGLYKDRALSVDNVTALTGIPLKADVNARPFKVSLNPDARVRFDLHDPTDIGVELAIAPRLTVDPKAIPGLVPLGSFADGTCGFVTKDCGDWKSVWAAAGPMPTRLLRGLAESAGARIFVKGEDGVYFGKDYVAIYSVGAGTKHVQLPRKAKVTEYFSGEEVCRKQDAFDFHMSANATGLFLLE